jgi:hypothetical protein
MANIGQVLQRNKGVSRPPAPDALARAGGTGNALENKWWSSPAPAG